jgi:hypothetical protein
MKKNNEKALGEYEVGYAKPPIGSQWKPGQSGNPGGRTPKKKAPVVLTEAIAAELNAPVQIAIDGKLQQVSLSTAVAKRLLHGVLRGPPKQLLACLTMLEKLGVFGLQQHLIDVEQEEATLFTSATFKKLLAEVEFDSVDDD